MMSNKEWLAFFRNIKNKQYLLNLFVNYLCKLPSQLSSLLPKLASNENGTFKISSSVTKVFECSHKETNIRSIFHAFQQNANVAIC